MNYYRQQNGPNYHAYNSYPQQNWSNYYAYDTYTQKRQNYYTYVSRKNKTNPFIYNKSHPENDSSKKSLFRKCKQKFLCFKKYKQKPFLDKTKGRKKKQDKKRK